MDKLIATIPKNTSEEVCIALSEFEANGWNLWAFTTPSGTSIIRSREADLPLQSSCNV